jgi:hypothetical protein
MRILKNSQPKNNCPNCVLYRNKINELEAAFIEADVQNVRRLTQLRDEISKSDEDRSESNTMLNEDKRPLPAKISRRTKWRSEIEAQGDIRIAADIQKRIAGPEYYAHTCRREGF